MNEWLTAAGAGLLAGGALFVGALIAWFVKVPSRVVASVMAFGAGVLISALAFDLVGEAMAESGLWPTVSGFAVGAIVYVGVNVLLDRLNARNKKGSAEGPGTGTGIAVGALLDGVPESMVLGLSMLGGQGVSIPILTAVIISNLPEGLSSTAELKAAGRKPRFVFALWGGIALAAAISSLLGFTILADAPVELTGFITSLAAGAMLAMISDTMIPDAFRKAHNYTGLLATLGFLTSLVIHQLA
ncbi:ZIP family zinc transporter [Aurantimicrobium minutum]|uniref:ZIP family metal transporter n=1 Tax=Aurantimicrobium minutum TaxID=708131 RepID=UPI002475F813|nr:ZIP family zinc transporter [Aurantimicrobium minutum]MDH6278130.1 ZIP family zinc transporter [Aurantimicrobium minutum]